MASGKPHIVLVILAVAAILGSCNRPHKIPAGKMTDIYAEMFLQDQWISSNGKTRRQADTSLVYDQIFKKYGYDFEDFDYSVRRYLKKPDKFAKILKMSARKLDVQRKRLERIEDAFNKRVVWQPYKQQVFDISGLVRIDSTFIHLDTLSVADTLCRCDSLCCCCDSLCCRSDSLCKCDLLCCRCDSLCKCDSLCCCRDTLSLMDTLCPTDSLKSSPDTLSAEIERVEATEQVVKKIGFTEPETIEIKLNDERRNGLRANPKQKARNVAGSKSASDKRKAL